MPKLIDLEQHIRDRIQVLEGLVGEDVRGRLDELNMILDMVEDHVDGEGAKYHKDDHVYIRKCGETKVVVSSKPDGHPNDRLYVLRGKDGSLDHGWREYELRCVKRNRV